MIGHDTRLDDEACEHLIASRVPAEFAHVVAQQLSSIHEQYANEQTCDYATLEGHWRAWTLSHRQDEHVRRSLELARRIREAGFRAYVHVGIGGSDLGPRVCHEVLDHTRHNELPDDTRGAPRIYFAGDTFDPRPLRELLAMLRDSGDLVRTVFNIVSRSGKTPETLCAMLAIKAALGSNWARQVVATTLEDSRRSILYALATSEPFLGVLPVPEGVGGRFSVASPVGLLPLAVATNEHTDSMKRRVDDALAGYAEGHERMCLPPDDLHNIAFRLARWLHFAEEQCGIGNLLFYDYSGCRMLGDWLVQLYTESIQERGKGMNVIAARGPTSNHSLLNGVVNGPRDKIVLFVHWQDLGEDLEVPLDEEADPGLQIFTGKAMSVLQEASFRGTVKDFTDKGVPCLVLSVAKRDAYHLFLVMRLLMDMVAVKGRLQGLHLNEAGEPDFAHELTYQQDGVEGYKQAMREFLR